MSKPNGRVIVPKHVGLILDGNRRWAKKNNKPPLEGHRAGFRNLQKIGEAAWERGVETLSAYVFSTENWQRSQEEVDYLMKLLVQVSRNELRRIHKKGIRIRIIGSREGLSDEVIKVLDETEQLTQNNRRGTLALCFNYGGQQEITDAAKRMIKGKVEADEVDIEKFADHLYQPDIPPIDLIIRTSGEQRISNFMLWRAAYSELYFVKEFWPDFTPAMLEKAFKEYSRRQRRYGS